MMRIILAIAIGLAGASAIAEEAYTPSATETAPTEQEAPAAATEPAPSAAPAQEAEPQRPAAKAAPKPKAAHAPARKPAPAQNAETSKPKAAGGLSQSKFLGMLYSEIAKSRPDKNSAGPGVVSASFRVNASGKIDNIAIKNSTSPAHAEIVKKILAKVQAPPPPEGVFEGVQDFKFH